MGKSGPKSEALPSRWVRVYSLICADGSELTVTMQPTSYILEAGESTVRLAHGKELDGTLACLLTLLRTSCATPEQQP